MLVLRAASLGGVVLPTLTFRYQSSQEVGDRKEGRPSGQVLLLFLRGLTPFPSRGCLPRSCPTSELKVTQATGPSEFPCSAPSLLVDNKSTEKFKVFAGSVTCLHPQVHR